MPPEALASLAAVPPHSAPLHLAVGMFDGVHRGHQAVIQRAVAAVRAYGGTAGVLTFWPHPSVVLRPAAPTRVMQDPAAKAEVLRGLGVQLILTEPFSAEIGEVEAGQFVSWLRARLPGLAGLYVGENFRFGRGRRGDAALLAQTGREAGIAVVVAPPVLWQGAPVSSTRIRTLLAAGEMAAVAGMLGRPYASQGLVMTGKRLGRTLGFPTLNLIWSPPAAPRFGVYAVRVSDANGRTRPGVANYGLRPTVEQATEPRLEVHVFGDCPWTDGKVLSVDWERFLRPEQAFPNVAALRAQIQQDCAAARAVLGLPPA
ncbi:MAG: riboflavin biosynthesis protein RibF [Verrucomicrobia bacterium]|nr:riboflavin biosynthesis protein RibF [Verrucomicrobiota bacterium]